MQVDQVRLSLKDVCLTVPFGGGSADLLKNINLEVCQGDRVGVIGSNGAGKSVLLKVASGIYPPSSGFYQASGNMLSLFNLSSGINKNWTGRQNAELKLLMYGIKPSEVAAYLEDIQEFAQIDKYFDSAVKFYSAGMAARLAFAIMTSIKSDILVLDEWISVGDASFKQNAANRFNSRVSETGAVLFCTHSPDILRSWATKVIWVNDGEICLEGTVQEVLPAFHKFIGIS